MFAITKLDTFFSVYFEIIITLQRICYMKVLWEAAISGDVEKCKEAIGHGANLNWKNKECVSIN